MEQLPEGLGEGRQATQLPKDAVAAAGLEITWEVATRSASHEAEDTAAFMLCSAANVCFLASVRLGM
jgi:hypothetical protein